MRGTNIDVVELDGITVDAVGVCGGYQNFGYIVGDQHTPAQRIANGTVTIPESFSNFDPATGGAIPHPTPRTPTINLATTGLSDIQALYNVLPPACPGPNATLSFKQTFTVYVGSSASGTAYVMLHRNNWTWATDSGGLPTFTRTTSTD